MKISSTQSFYQLTRQNKEILWDLYFAFPQKTSTNETSWREYHELIQKVFSYTLEFETKSNCMQSHKTFDENSKQSTLRFSQDKIIPTKKFLLRSYLENANKTFPLKEEKHSYICHKIVVPVWGKKWTSVLLDGINLPY